MAGSGSQGVIDALMVDLQLLKDGLGGIDERIAARFVEAREELTRVENEANARTNAFVNGVAHLDATVSGLQITLIDSFQGLDRELQSLSSDLAVFDQTRIQTVVDLSQGNSNATGALSQAQETLSGKQSAIASTVGTAHSEIASEHAQQQADATLNHDSLNLLGTDSTTRTQSLLTSLTALQGKANEALQSVETSVDNAVSTSEAGMSNSFGTLNDSLDGSAQGVSGSLETLLDIAEKLGDEYGDEVKEVTATIRQITDLLDKIRPILELAEQLA
jgi:hypothetical protein